MITAEKYVEKVNEIYNENPIYRSGGHATDGTCDCIGMSRGALERAGATGVHNMGGTNNAVRHLDLDLQQLAGSSQLKLGDIVMRTRDKDDKNMRLPDRYRKGGSDYSEKWGETNFTHIGTVTRVYPLEITHMTDPRAKKDDSIKNWGWFGHLPWVERGAGPAPGPDPGPDPDPDPPQPQPETATAWAEKGSTVNMRAKPNTGCNLYDPIPIGAVVQVLEKDCSTDKKGNAWTKVSYKTRKGWYIMSKYLVFDDQGDGNMYIVHIPYLTRYKAEALLKNYPGAWMTGESGEGGDEGAVG